MMNYPRQQFTDYTGENKDNDSINHFSYSFYF